VAEPGDLSVQAMAGRASLVAKDQPPVPLGKLGRKTFNSAGRALSMSPTKRTSPSRPASATATEIFSFDVSSPTYPSLSCCTTHPESANLERRNLTVGQRAMAMAM
jgi:hypothetical protein